MGHIGELSEQGEGGLMESLGPGRQEDIIFSCITVLPSIYSTHRSLVYEWVCFVCLTRITQSDACCGIDVHLFLFHHHIFLEQGLIRHA